MKKGTLISLVILLIAFTTSCSQSSKESANKKSESQKGKSSETKKSDVFNQDKMDIELFKYLTSDNITSEDISQIQQAYADTKELWSLILRDFLTTTHYIDLTDPACILNTISFLPEVRKELKEATEGTYSYGNYTVTAPFMYLPQSVLINYAEYLFGKQLSDNELNSISSSYIPELNGYFVGSIGGFPGFGLPNEIEVKRYKDTYVAIASYNDNNSLSSSGIHGTYYLVFKKISTNEKTHFIYRWAYVNVEN